jgi:hypothetical protein
VPSYRIFYAEREVGPQGSDDDWGRQPQLQHMKQPSGYVQQIEMEELVEADSGPEALDRFFREHVRDNSELAWIDDEGQARTVQGLDYDPELSYIWVEDGKLMEFQGLDEATPGMVTCPLCNGHGEIDEALAEEFDEVWNEDEDAIDADVKG